MSAGSERFQLYHCFDELVLPLSDGGMDAVEAVAVLPYGGFACCSPSDASSETPQVPRSLPRPLPRGNYSWGAYGDERNLYVVVAAEDGAAVDGLVARDDALDQLIIFQPDGLWYRTLQVPLDGVASAVSVAYSHGPRKASCSESEWDWEVRRLTPRSGRCRVIWRIARDDLEPHIRAGALRVSISRTSIRSLEPVAWGAYGVWGPRFDECGTLRFEEDPAAMLVPQLRELTLTLDPIGLSASLQFDWKNPFQAEEFLPCAPTEPGRSADWSVFTARVNGQLQQYAFSDTESAEPFALQPGFNEIHVTTRGGGAVRLFLEVAAGEQIGDLCAGTISAAGGPIPLRCGEVADWVRRWVGRFVVANPAPWARYERWMGRLGSAVSEWCRGTEPDPTWREWVHALGIHTLGYQREDGTFSGFHLGVEGQTDVRWRGGAYDSGQIGDFWVRCYRATGDERFLTASQRLVDAYSGYRIEFNPNFAAFGLFHLASHYGVTGDAQALAHIEYYLPHAVACRFLPLGFHGGHNYYTIYASIILTGMAMAARVLPVAHPLRAGLLIQIRRMTNQTLTRLQHDGSFDSRDRHFVGERLWIDGLFAVAPLLDDPDERRKLDQVLKFILSRAMARTGTGQSSAHHLTPMHPASLAASAAVAEYASTLYSI